MRLAAIDIGTNSVHMIVVRVRPDFSFEVVDREKEMVRLGAGGLDGKKLTPEAMAAALQALSRSSRASPQSHQVDEILAVATSATREAENGGAFLRAIERKTGIRARLITGTEEARLIHLAAVYGVDTPKPAVVIDIGGGSVEITLGSRTRGRVRAQLQDRRHPPDRALRRLRSDLEPRRTQDDEVHPRAGRPLPRAHRRAGLRPRDRHVGHDPVARHGGHRDRSRLGAAGSPQPARAGEEPAQAAQDGGRHGSRGAHAPARPRSAARRPDGRRRGPARHAAARSSAPKRSRCAIWRCAKACCSTTSTGTASTSRGSIAIPTSAAAR